MPGIEIEHSTYRPEVITHRSIVFDDLLARRPDPTRRMPVGIKSPRDKAGRRRSGLSDCDRRFARHACNELDMDSGLEELSSNPENEMIALIDKSRDPDYFYDDDCPPSETRLAAL